MEKKLFAGLVLWATVAIGAVCQAEQKSPLLITPADVRLVPENSGDFSEISGYHLYIRKKPGIESVMLTETTKDPSGKSDNYAYRAFEYNSVNGDEIRFLNGKKLESEQAKFSLVDSTAEPDIDFGEAFHIFIPSKIQYGYPWARNGVVEIDRGTFINIRAFAKKYADYTGQFYDNPYMFDLERRVRRRALPTPEPEPEETPTLTDDYNPVAGQKFSEFSDIVKYSKGPETIVEDILSSIRAINPKDKADIVFAIDATGSMKDDIEQLRKEWVPELLKAAKEFGHLRLGLLLYRDYVDNFRYKGIPVRFYDFTTDTATFERNLNSFVIKGTEGGDIPEAVYEALYGALCFYEWDSTAQRKIILIGDAEPHPLPRGTKKYTKELVTNLAKQKNIHIEAIITPDDKGRRGR